MKIYLIAAGLMLACLASYSQDISSAYPVVLPDGNSVSYVVPAGQTVNITSAQSVTLGLGVRLQPGSNVHISISSSAIPSGFTPRSYVQEDRIKIPGITDVSQVDALNVSQKQTTFYYTDGLGRIVQTVYKQATPLQHDLVQNRVYDNLGRESVTYLPYAAADGSGNYKADADAAQQSFYRNGYGDKVADDAEPFSQQLFENSPLQRLLQSGSVGAGFQPNEHPNTMIYRTNTGDDHVISWQTDGSYQGSYNANTLAVSEATDAAGAKTIMFRDVAGHVVLKRQLANETINGVTQTYFDTYYIYNAAGLVSYVVQPKAVALMSSSNNWDITQSSVSKLVFKFVYDYRGRLIRKTVPGGAEINIVYDPLNRPVLIQDARLRGFNQWNYIKYDIKGDL